MRKFLLLLAGLAVASLTLTLARPALATEQPTGPSFATCPCLTGWYVNADETDNRPEATVDGLKFTGKNLIHHKTSLALTDVHAGSFTAVGTDDKVVMKYETDSPYTTIVQTPDGKFWSSHITTGPGSQAQPVDTPHDLVGIPQRGASGGLTEDTKVVSFGVGYWTETGSTVVSSVAFHGVTYDLRCKPPTTTPPTHPTTPPTSKPTTPPATTSPTSEPSRSSTTGVPIDGGAAGGSGGALAVTGPSTGVVAGIAAALLAIGGALLLVARRKRRFIA